MIIVAVGVFFFYSKLGLAQTHIGLILAHAALGAPFVVITVTATLAGFDQTLMRAAASLGAGAITRFPPGSVAADRAGGSSSGGLFAFAASFDEVVVVLLMGGPRTTHHSAPDVGRDSRADQPDDPRGRAPTLLIIFAVLVLFTVEWLRRRSTEAAP